MEKDEGLEKVIEAFGVETTCDLRCEACDRYFSCQLPEKLERIDTIRMKRARNTMAQIKHKIAVLAGKGGVGKSMTTAVLAQGLAARGRKVVVLDQDFDGPCMHRMLGAHNKYLTMGEKGIVPADLGNNLKLISLGLVIQEEEVLSWFHKMRRDATEELLSHVDYGEADYLMVDLPPGTSSDAVNIMQYIPDLSGAIVVTVPARVSQLVAKKATLLCQQAGLNVLGVVENMSGYVCKGCGKRWDILQAGGGELLAKETNIRLLGKIPLDTRVSVSNDTGESYFLKYPDSEAAKAVGNILDTVEQLVGWKG
jgi:ATP-binding protein involved in chromosome partitioning